MTDLHTKRRNDVGRIEKMPNDCWSYVILFLSEPKEYRNLCLTIRGLYDYVVQMNCFCCKNVEFCLAGLSLPSRVMSHVYNISLSLTDMKCLFVKSKDEELEKFKKVWEKKSEKDFGFRRNLDLLFKMAGILKLSSKLLSAPQHIHVNSVNQKLSQKFPSLKSLDIQDDRTHCSCASYSWLTRSNWKLLQIYSRILTFDFKYLEKLTLQCYSDHEVMKSRTIDLSKTPNLRSLDLICANPRLITFIDPDKLPRDYLPDPIFENTLTILNLKLGGAKLKRLCLENWKLSFSILDSKFHELEYLDLTSCILKETTVSKLPKLKQLHVGNLNNIKNISDLPELWNVKYSDYGRDSLGSEEHVHNGDSWLENMYSMCTYQIQLKDLSKNLPKLRNLEFNGYRNEGNCQTVFPSTLSLPSLKNLEFKFILGNHGQFENWAIRYNLPSLQSFKAEFDLFSEAPLPLLPIDKLPRRTLKTIMLKWETMDYEGNPYEGTEIHYKICGFLSLESLTCVCVCHRITISDCPCLKKAKVDVEKKVIFSSAKMESLKTLVVDAENIQFCDCSFPSLNYLHINLSGSRGLLFRFPMLQFPKLKTLIFGSEKTTSHMEIISKGNDNLRYLKLINVTKLSIFSLNLKNLRILAIEGKGRMSWEKKLSVKIEVSSSVEERETRKQPTITSEDSLFLLYLGGVNVTKDLISTITKERDESDDIELMLESFKLKKKSFNFHFSATNPFDKIRRVHMRDSMYNGNDAKKVLEKKVKKLIIHEVVSWVELMNKTLRKFFKDRSYSSIGYFYCDY